MVQRFSMQGEDVTEHTNRKFYVFAFQRAREDILEHPDANCCHLFASSNNAWILEDMKIRRKEDASHVATDVTYTVASSLSRFKTICK